MDSSSVSNSVPSVFRIGGNAITTTDITIALAVAFFIIIMAVAVLIVKLLTDRQVSEAPTLIICSSTPKYSSTAAQFPSDMHVDVLYLDSPYAHQQQYIHRTLFATSASPTSSAPVSPFGGSSSARHPVAPASESKKNE
jgi:hypothetical protein